MRVTIAVDLKNGNISKDCTESLYHLHTDENLGIVFLTDKKRYELPESRLAEINKFGATLRKDIADIEGVVFSVAGNEVLHESAVEYIRDYYRYNKTHNEIPKHVRDLFTHKAAKEVLCRHLISCIIPVYNAERYLREAIESVVNQTIGFEENVQLILVNDGSIDSSGAICEEYAEKFPNNVLYIKQENQGVSAARNAGLDVAVGKYIAFLNADDKFDVDFMKECVNTLNNGKTQFVAGHVTALDGVAKPRDTRLPYLFTIPKSVAFTHKAGSHYVFKSISAVMFAKNLTDVIRFKQEAAPFQEGFFLMDLIMNSKTVTIYEVIDKAVCFKRGVVNKKESILSYSGDISCCLKKIIVQLQKYSADNNKLSKFLQWGLLGNFLVYQNLLSLNAITLNEMTFDSLAFFISRLDDDVLLKISNITDANKQLLMMVNASKTYDNFAVLVRKHEITIVNIDEKNKSLEFSGYLLRDSLLDNKLIINSDGILNYIAFAECDNEFSNMDEVDPFYKYYKFSFTIPVINDYTFDIFSYFPCGSVEYTQVLFDVPEGGRISSYYNKFFGNFCLKYTDKEAKRFGIKNIDSSYLNIWINQCVKKFSLSYPQETQALKNYMLLCNNYKKKKIYLFIDEPNIPEDRFGFLLSKLKFTDEQVFILIQPNSRPKYIESMSQFGTVINYGSIEHMVVSFTADFFISLDGSDRVRFPFNIVKNVEIRAVCNSIIFGKCISITEFIENRDVPSYVRDYFRVPDTLTCNTNVDTPLLLDNMQSNGCRYYSKFNENVGFISDEFLYDTWKDVAPMIMFTPDNWRDYIDEISLMLISSVWTGLNGEWLGVSNSDPNHPKRIALDEIISACKNRNIPVVFYSKEDPPHYTDYINLAQKCDYVFTTCVEVVDKYKEDCGHNRCYALPFAFNPLVHNPIGMTVERFLNTVLFAGSWMTKYTERCSDLGMIFDGVIESGNNLKIINRNSHYGNDPRYNYPQKYLSFVSPRMGHLELMLSQTRYNWAININSVKDSFTMFANRLYELSAMGILCLSNYSKGVSNLLPFTFLSHNRYEVTRMLNSMTSDEIYEHQICAIRHVMKGDSSFKRFMLMLEKVGLQKHLTERKVAVVYDNYTENVQFMYDSQTLVNKELLSISDWEKRYSEFDMTAFFSSNMFYGAFYLEDMVNGFKYTNSDFITKDAYLNGSILVEGVQHGYVTTVSSKYRTVFWNGSHEYKFLKVLGDDVLVENGYSIDSLNYNAVIPVKSSSNVGKVYKLSVIVPVYNNGDFLYGRSFASLLRSSMFEDMEIILVDDGSTDVTTEGYINLISSRYPNVRTYFFRDGGSGSAARPRNKGIELSTAEYVAFLDTDDEAINDGYTMLYNRALETGADITVGNYHTIGHAQFSTDNFAKFSSFANGNDVITDTKGFLRHCEFFPSSHRDCIYKKNIIIENSIKQVEGAFSEDTFFFMQVLCKAKKFTAINLPIFVYYRAIQASVMNNIGSGYFKRVLIIQEPMNEWILANDLIEDFMKLYWHKHANAKIALLSQINTDNSEYNLCVSLLIAILKPFLPYYDGNDERVTSFLREHQSEMLMLLKQDVQNV